MIRGMMVYSLMYPGANIAQQMIGANTTSLKVIDWRQTSRFLVYGTLIHAPLVHGWVTIIGRLVPGRTAFDLFKIAAIDQATFAPFSISMFFMGLSILEGKTWTEIKEEWEVKLPATWKVNFT